jgi:hypothetical protein
MDVTKFATVGSTQARHELLLTFLCHCRRNIRERGKVAAMTTDGVTPDNTFASEGVPGSLRSVGAEYALMRVAVPTGDNFVLIVKHPNAFTALLEELAPHFRCFAVVRNPLALLASWNSIDHPLREGHAPVAELLSAELTTRLSCIGTTLERQLALLSWYFEQYERWLHVDQVLYYEDIVHSRGEVLARIVPAAQELDESLEDRNINCAYDRGFMMRAGEALLKTEGAYWHFYDRRAIAALLDTIAHL